MVQSWDMAGRKPVSKPQWRVNPQAPQRLQELFTCESGAQFLALHPDGYRNVALCCDADTAKRLLALILIAEGKGAL